MEADAQSAGHAGRFNVLFTQDRPHGSEHWTSQLPRLLEPQGVTSFVVRSGRDAIALTGRVELHAAVIDLATPLEESGLSPAPADAAGLWIMDLFRRLPRHPPVVLVHGASYSQRQLDRVLRESLRLGAFSVLSKPVELEMILGVFQRLVEREYQGFWPGAGQP